MATQMCIVCGGTFESESISNIFCAQHNSTSLAYGSAIQAAHSNMAATITTANLVPGNTLYAVDPELVPPPRQWQAIAYTSTSSDLLYNSNLIVNTNTTPSSRDSLYDNQVALHKNGLKIVNGKLVKVI
jgi:hypothetical protein